jgi:hypothetical protein
VTRGLFNARSRTGAYVRWMTRSNACNARLPSSGASSRSTRLASQGMIVTDTKSDASTV